MREGVMRFALYVWKSSHRHLPFISPRMVPVKHVSKKKVYTKDSGQKIFTSQICEDSFIKGKNFSPQKYWRYKKDHGRKIFKGSVNIGRQRANLALRPYPQQSLSILCVNEKLGHHSANHGLRPYPQQRLFILGFDKTRTIFSIVAHEKRPKIKHPIIGRQRANLALRPYPQQSLSILCVSEKIGRQRANLALHPYPQKSPSILRVNEKLGFGVESAFYRATPHHQTNPYTEVDFFIDRWGGPYKEFYYMDPMYLRRIFFESGLMKLIRDRGRYIRGCYEDMLYFGELIDSKRFMSVPDISRWFFSADEGTRLDILDHISRSNIHVVAASSDTLLAYPALTVRYEPPPPGVLKYCSDGALASSERMAWGGVWRDSFHNVGPIHTGKLTGVLTPIQVEGCGIYHGLANSYGSSLRWKKSILQIDNAELAYGLNSGQHPDDSGWPVTFRDIKDIMSSFPYLDPKVEFVLREGNHLANYIVGETRDNIKYDWSEVCKRARADRRRNYFRIKFRRQTEFH